MAPPPTDPIEGMGEFYVFADVSGQLWASWRIADRRDFLQVKASWQSWFPMSRYDGSFHGWRLLLPFAEQLKLWADQWFAQDSQHWPPPEPARMRGARAGLRLVDPAPHKTPNGAA